MVISYHYFFEHGECRLLLGYIDYIPYIQFARSYGDGIFADG